MNLIYAHLTNKMRLTDEGLLPEMPIDQIGILTNKKKS